MFYVLIKEAILLDKWVKCSEDLKSVENFLLID